jgi:hypothetical protein
MDKNAAITETKKEKPQAYEIPRLVRPMGESSRNRPEVTLKPQVAASGVPLTFDLTVPPAGTGPAEVT